MVDGRSRCFDLSPRTNPRRTEYRGDRAAQPARWRESTIVRELRAPVEIPPCARIVLPEQVTHSGWRLCGHTMGIRNVAWLLCWTDISMGKGTPPAGTYHQRSSVDSCL